MPKMGVEAKLDELEKGLTWPGTQLQKFAIPADDLKKFGLRKPKGPDQQYYAVWQLNIGEQGGQMTSFYGLRLVDAVNKAFDWKFPAAQATNG